MSTTVEDSFTFKIKTTFAGTMTHLSATISIAITCANSYTLSQATPVNPQFKAHDLAASGFELPTYTSAQQTGCPTNQIQISSSNTEVASVSGLEDPASDGSGGFIVKPSDSNVH